MDVGVNDAERETFNAALATGEQTLTAVGFHPFAARRAAKMFREYDTSYSINCTVSQSKGLNSHPAPLLRERKS
jgi:predicted Zn-dependent protease